MAVFGGVLLNVAQLTSKKRALTNHGRCSVANLNRDPGLGPGLEQFGEPEPPIPLKKKVNDWIVIRGVRIQLCCNASFLSILRLLHIRSFTVRLVLFCFLVLRLFRSVTVTVTVTASLPQYHYLNTFDQVASQIVAQQNRDTPFSFPSM